jgi:hypothetical protein
MSQRKIPGGTYAGRIPAPRRAWKQARQYTGRSSVGLKGTVVFCPHDEQTTS